MRELSISGDLQPHQLRVIGEHIELAEKINLLARFVLGPIFPTLPAAEKNRLLRQRAVMSLYLDVLAERIAAFGLLDNNQTNS